LFVTAGVGGPTIVTDQTLASSGLASHGLLFHGQDNRLVSFAPKYLHGKKLVWLGVTLLILALMSLSS
jgi:hypothetical protein